MSRTIRRTTGLVTFGGVLALLAGVGCSGSQPAKETSRPAASGGGRGDRSHGAPRPRARLSPRDRAGRAQCQGAGAVRGETAEGRAQRHRLPDRRHRVRPPQHVRRRHSHADARPAREPGAQVQPLPHHGPLLADARGPPHRPQPPYEQRGRDHGGGHGLPGQLGRPAAQRHAARRDPPPERLQHVRLREVPRDGAVGSERLRAVRPLAHPLRVRQVLRLHRRRDQPVGAARLRRHRQGRGAARPELPLHDRHDQPGDQLDPCPAVAHAGQALLHVLRHRRHARPAPRAEGVDREVQGPVRRRLGQVPRGDLRAPEEAGHHPRRTRSWRTSPPTSRTGTSSRPTSSGCSRGRWRSMPRSPRTPTTRSAAW